MFKKYSYENYGNPSSNHIYGSQASQAIRESRLFFAHYFDVAPEQVIFTGSGSEANNLAITGVLSAASLQTTKKPNSARPRVLTSGIEHPSVHKTIESLLSFGIESDCFKVKASGEVDLLELESKITNHTALLTLQQVNHILGSQIPVEEIAKKAKELNPSLIVHSDVIQAFGKVPVPHSHSSIDLLSISSHKVHGPKGIGALIVLNPRLLQNGLRPIIWGGGQENGFRSGTQSAGLIAGFKWGAEQTLTSQKEHFQHFNALRGRLSELLAVEFPQFPQFHEEQNALDPSFVPRNSRVHPDLIWNSPPSAVPYIVNLSVPGIPAGALAKLLEERRCLVSVGSACNSKKPQPDPVLTAMQFPMNIQTSAIRISFSYETQLQDIDSLVQALKESVAISQQLMGRSPKRKTSPFPTKPPTNGVN